MWPPLAHTSAIPLAQSCGDPPPKLTTPSHPSRSTASTPAITWADVGLGVISSKTSYAMPCSSSRSVKLESAPISLSTRSVTTRTLPRPRPPMSRTAFFRAPGPIRDTVGM